MNPKRGQIWSITTIREMTIRVNRVSRKGLWADIRVTQRSGATWTKRQPLPFPPSWKLVSSI